MKDKIITEIKAAMHTVISAEQMSILSNVLMHTLQNVDMTDAKLDTQR